MRGRSARALERLTSAAMGRAPGLKVHLRSAVSAGTATVALPVTLVRGASLAVARRLYGRRG